MKTTNITITLLMAIGRKMVMFLFFMVVVFDSKGNTFGKSVQ